MSRSCSCPQPFQQNHFMNLEKEKLLTSLPFPSFAASSACLFRQEGRRTLRWMEKACSRRFPCKMIEWLADKNREEALSKSPEQFHDNISILNCTSSSVLHFKCAWNVHFTLIVALKIGMLQIKLTWKALYWTWQEQSVQRMHYHVAEKVLKVRILYSSIRRND